MDKNTAKTSFGKYVNTINLKDIADPIQEMDRVRRCLSQQDFTSSLGFKSLSVSQLSRKHHSVDSDILAAIFAELAMNIKN